MEICGECQGEYSEQCGRKTACVVHDAECWDCRDCEDQVSSLEDCSFCDRKQMEEDMFFCHQCDSYICVHQFQVPEGKDIEVTKLRCGCTELNLHIIAFLCNFCTICHRKLNKRIGLNLVKCKICRQGKHFKPNRKCKEEKQSSLSLSDSLSDSEWMKSQESEWMENSEQNDAQSESFQRENSIKDQKTPNGSKKTKKQKPPKSAKSSKTEASQKDPQSLIVVKTPKPSQRSSETDQLRQKVSQVNESYCISQFTRMQFKKILLQEKEDNCLVCYLPYSLTRKPMMICLQQHMLCSFCIKDNKILECPLCRDPICRQKIAVCKERTRALEIEAFLFQRIQNKKKWLVEYKKLTKGNIEVFEGKIAEVQTQISVHNQTKRYPQRKRGPSRGRQKLTKKRI